MRGLTTLGYADVEDAPALEVVLDPDPTFMEIHYTLHDGQA
jgi:hypothetical protein